jgi:hypothetical protein
MLKVKIRDQVVVSAGRVLDDDDNRRRIAVALDKI